MYQDEPGLTSPITAKIAWANACFTTRGATFLQKADFAALVEQMRSAIRAAHRAREQAGILELCADCDTLEGGSCCGEGLEDKYDGRLLLLNRLCGVTLPEQREASRSCFFLSPTGCVLEARHVICVNYRCATIDQKVAQSLQQRVWEAEGAELQLIFRAHDRLTALLCQASP